jgi:NAD(P)H-quinone oxidoreductase subunit 3
MSDMDSFLNYGFLGALLFLGICLGIAPVILPLLITPRSKGKKTQDTYECGMDTIGSAWVRFGVAFYLFALIFVAFEVDVLYLLPVAFVFDNGDYAWRDLILTTMFLGILSLAIIYAWRQGVFQWEEGHSPFELESDIEPEEDDE